MAVPPLVAAAAKSRTVRRLALPLTVVAVGLCILPVLLAVVATNGLGSTPSGAACTSTGEWRTTLEAQYPAAAPHVDVIAAAATQHGVDGALLSALLWRESGFDTSARNPSGAAGIAQLMPATALALGVTNPHDPRQAIPAAARYLAEQIAAFDGDVRLGLAAYNAGPGNVRRYGGVPPFTETQRYVEAVTAKANSFGTVDPHLCAGEGPGVVWDGDLAVVHGIRVHPQLAGQLDALLRHAAADGIALSGSGWRSPQRTAELRVINRCPDVWTARPGSCAVPTAIPGTSMHEKGLAIDFTYRGSTVRSRSSPAFRWLAVNASRYGLHNLPSEPWHWSTTGR